MPQPQNFLIQILITVNADGSFNTTIRSYYEGKTLDKKNPLPVNAGDQLGWVVQVAMPSGRKSLPYQLVFDTEFFFGTPELDVPAGGMSPFLRVLDLKNKTKYSLFVTGLGCVLDPEIQSGTDTGAQLGIQFASAFVVTWDIAANTMSYTKSGGAATPFPMQVALGDKVDFVAGAGGQVSNFTIAFADNDNGWATPFDPNNKYLFADPANPKHTGQKGVGDPNDSGASFPFTASASVDGIAAPPSPSVTITM
jgi:hypothetical protein